MYYFLRSFIFLSLLFSGLLSAQNQAPGAIVLELNGNLVTTEALAGELFCMQAADTFTIRYLSPPGEDSAHLTFSRLDLLGQISLGKPQIIGSQVKVPGHPAPLVFQFTLKELITQPGLLRTAGTSLRTSLEIGPMLLVEGNRIKGTLPLAPLFRRINLVLVPGC